MKKGQFGALYFIMTIFWYPLTAGWAKTSLFLYAMKAPATYPVIIGTMSTAASTQSRTICDDEFILFMLLHTLTMPCPVSIVL